MSVYLYLYWSVCILHEAKYGFAEEEDEESDEDSDWDDDWDDDDFDSDTEDGGVPLDDSVCPSGQYRGRKSILIVSHTLESRPAGYIQLSNFDITFLLGP